MSYIINPYNFIPFGNGCLRAPFSSGKLTGRIHCEIIPKTDIFIPNTSNGSCTWTGRKCNNKKDGVFNHKAREFFSYTDLPEGYDMSSNSAPENPVIPGSELRGMVRSMYEAFTDSCLSAFEEERELSSRTNIPNEPGILKRTEKGWLLYKARAYKVNTKDDGRHLFFAKREKRLTGTDGQSYPTFSEVRFNYNTVTSELRTRNRTIQIRSDYVTDFGNSKTYRNIGYLVIGEDFIRKHCENIFKIIDEDKPVYSDSDALEKSIVSYNRIIDYYNDPKINKASDAPDFYRESRINAEAGTGIVYPVWYKILDGRVYLSPSCIGRFLYQNKLSRFVKNYVPCSVREKVCEACSLFGFVSESDEKQALPSSLRFSDAVFSGSKPLYQDITTLKELSGPKITSMDMYTHLAPGKNGDFWTYDFFVNGNKYQLLNEDDILLNGRKFYYHSKESYRAVPDRNGITQTERNITIRPMKCDEKNKFEFDVYFEHISQEQLRKLLIVLSLRGNNSDYAYKLGTGKPLGLGSVKIKVLDVFTRNITENFKYSYISVKDQYKDCFENVVNDNTLSESFCEFERNSEIRNMLESLTSLTYIKENERVLYPIGTDRRGNSDKGYQWFVNNRGSVGRPCFSQMLYKNKNGRLNNNG